MIQTPNGGFQFPRAGRYTGYEVDGSTVVNENLPRGAILQAMAGFATGSALMNSSGTQIADNAYAYGRPTSGYNTPFAVVSEDTPQHNLDNINRLEGVTANLRTGGAVNVITSGYCRALVKHGVSMVAGVTLLAPTNDAFHLTPCLSNGLLYASTAASAEHENTTDAADFDKSYTIPANTLRVGDVFRIRGLVTVNDNNSSDTLTVIVKFGSVTINTQAAEDVEDSDLGVFDVIVTVRAIGATGKIIAHSMATVDTDATAGPIVAAAIAETTLDTTAAVKIAVNADWSAASADNEVELSQLTVEKLSTPETLGSKPLAVAMETTTISASSAGHALAKVMLLQAPY